MAHQRDRSAFRGKAFRLTTNGLGMREHGVEIGMAGDGHALAVDPSRDAMPLQDGDVLRRQRSERLRLSFGHQGPRQGMG